jgi:hypothetical protein
MEYRGHWVKLAAGGFHPGTAAGPPEVSTIELLSGPYPYVHCALDELKPGSIFSITIRLIVGGKRRYNGMSYWHGPNGLDALYERD